jgi:hypothetical protein
MCPLLHKKGCDICDDDLWLACLDGSMCSIDTQMLWRLEKDRKNKNKELTFTVFYGIKLMVQLKIGINHTWNTLFDKGCEMIVLAGFLNLYVKRL